MTTNLNVYQEPDNWGDCIPPRLLGVIAGKYDAMTKIFRWYMTAGVRLNQRLTTYDILSEMRLYMPRKGKQNGNTDKPRFHDNRGTGGGNEWKWANIRLDDEDIAILEQSDASLEFLAACIVVLADDGIGVTIKPVDAGKSFCCTLNRPSDTDTGVVIGVSSFAGTIRDALLVSLHKLDHKLGGEFANAEHFVSATPERPRFR